MRFLLAGLLSLCSLHLAAQDVTIKGIILLEEDNLPLGPVLIKTADSTSVGTSDSFGYFEIPVTLPAVLVFSKSGFIDYTLHVDGPVTLLTVRLTQRKFISTGYSDDSAETLSNASASVQQQNFNAGLIYSPKQLIQGRVAGVQVTTGSGEPGSYILTAIRGLSSMQINSPLIVLDGLPLSDADSYAGSTNFGKGTSQPRDPLNFINPADVERIDILKDASAAAIYGSRGSPGVILIKTKDGAGSKNRFQFASHLSMGKQKKGYDLLNRDQYLKGLEDRGVDSNANDYGADTDWQDEINETAISQKYDLSYSNSYKSGNYRASFSYEDQPGIIKETGLKKINGRLNFNHELLNNKLQLTGRTAFSRLEDQYALITTNAGFEGDLLGASYAANPTWDDDPELQPFAFRPNPLAMIKYHEDNSTTKGMFLNFSLSYALTSDIAISASAGVNKNNSVREAAVSPDLFMSNSVYGNGRASVRTLDGRTDIQQITGTYKKSIGASRIEFLAGYSYQKFRQSGRTIAGWGFNDPATSAMIRDLRSSAYAIQNVIPDNYVQYGLSADVFFITQLSPPNITQLPPGDKPVTSVRSVVEENYITEDEMKSFFTKFNYSYRSSLFFSATLRADNSSLFGSTNDYGLFPAASIAWRISEEDFLPEIFSELKLRLSAGKSGNQNIPHNASKLSYKFETPFIDFGGLIDLPPYNATSVDNPDLKWETLSELNVGIDVGLGNRIQASLDVYRRTTTDILYDQLLPQPAPVASVLANSSGKIINTGTELGLTYDAIKKNNWNVTFSMNVSYNKNVLKDFAGTINAGNVFGQGLTSSYVQRMHENQPLYSFYLREFTGFDENGLSVYANSGNQKFVGKQPVPKIMIGFGSYLQYKNWDAEIFFSGLMGHSIYNNTANAYFLSGSLGNGRNVTVDVLTNGESAANEPEVSTRFLENASFIRLQNLDVGYNFFFKKKIFKTVRTSIGGQNLFLWTNYSGLDPDVFTGRIGLDYSTYPKARTFTFGIEATF